MTIEEICGRFKTDYKFGHIRVHSVGMSGKELELTIMAVLEGLKTLVVPTELAEESLEHFLRLVTKLKKHRDPKKPKEAET